MNPNILWGVEKEYDQQPLWVKQEGYSCCYFNYFNRLKEKCNHGFIVIYDDKKKRSNNEKRSDLCRFR